MEKLIEQETISKMLGEAIDAVKAAIDADADLPERFGYAVGIEVEERPREVLDDLAISETFTATRIVSHGRDVVMKVTIIPNPHEERLGWQTVVGSDVTWYSDASLKLAPDAGESPIGTHALFLGAKQAGRRAVALLRDQAISAGIIG